MNKATQHPRHAPHAEPTDAPAWFITGCASGFGLERTRQAVARGADFPKAMT